MAAARADQWREHRRQREEPHMLKIAALCLGVLAVGLEAAAAQDIAGVEDCTKTTGLDKRTGCLQANVNFLHQLVIKNALDARQRLNAANTEIIALKSAVASLQASVEQLRAVQKAAGEKKPEGK
jgi:outer membrane murein-binding lipoprotein Lpp